MYTHTEIEKAVVRSQHTQRNWDLTKQIPKDDIKTLLVNSFKSSFLSEKKKKDWISKIYNTLL